MENNTVEKPEFDNTKDFDHIPKDWKVSCLGNIGDVLMCKRIMKHETLDAGDVPFYKIGTFGNIPDAYISKEKFLDYKSKYSFPKKGEVLISAAGTIGRTVIYDGKPAYFQDSNIVWLSHDETEVLNNYLFYYYKTNPWYTTTGGTIARLYNDNITKAKILIPPIPEQEKIAEVLGDIDRLIDKTQQLINKKKDLKTATMQKLFVFEDNCQMLSFEDIGTCIPTSNLSWNDVTEDGINPCILYGELFTTYKEIAKNIVSKTNLNTIIAKKNDILFPTSTTVDSISLISPSCLIDDNIGVGGDLFIFRPNNINGIYLSYLINNCSEIKNKLASRAQGLTIIHLHYDNIKDIKIPVPSQMKQNKIATILSDIDSEIEALEKELSKYQDLKTGMMQELLTGKIRLINNSNKNDNKVVQITSVKTQNKANDEFKDAVLISMLAYKFGSEKYPLGAFRRQKLSYLFKRYNNMPIDKYMKKAMGPYNPKMKYQGAEGIAIKNNYVKKVDSRGFVAGNSISKAEEYYNKYFSKESLEWLNKNFRFEKSNYLEVLATVDYAIIDLKHQNKDITLENIKMYIASDKEWKQKLDKDFFTDNAIIKAMATSKKLLNSY